MIKVAICFMLLMGSYSILVSQELIKKVGTDYITVDISSEKVKFMPIKFPNMEGNFIFHNDISDDLGGYLFRNLNSKIYQVIIYNYPSNKIDNEYLMKKDCIKSKIVTAYFTENNLYTIEKNNKTMNLVKRYHNGEISKTWRLEVNYEKNINSMLVDEKKKIILFSAMDNKVFLYSLDEEKIIFEDIGKFLFNISKESHNLYYSKGHDLICVEYNIDLSKNIVHTFLSSTKETVVELIALGNYYILVTQRVKNNLLINIFFNSIDWKNIYYLCSSEDGRLVKRKLIYKKNKGILFN